MTTSMKTFSAKHATFLLLAFSISLSSCSETADEFFGTAVLNTNTITDFGTPILAKHINDETTEFPDIPSSKKKGDEALIRVQNNILYMEKSLNDIKALSASNDTKKEIKQQAVALYEFVIPVYKNEYIAYAKLCDAKASQAQRDEILNSIEQKYTAEFEKLYTALLTSGKAFAEENNLNVDWN
jgi:Skp family chaperone for outer membrane proteins